MLRRFRRRQVRLGGPRFGPSPGRRAAAFHCRALYGSRRVAPRQYEWNDKAHLFLGESQLRQAIKQNVANAGHPTVLLDSFERITRKYAALIIEEARTGENSEGSSA